jgi:hypothetical protein
MVRMTNSDPPAFLIETPEADYDLLDDTAVAFLRFLHYIGLMTLEANKMPCPACGHKDPQDCAECGGLGWILRSKENHDE